MLTPSETRTLAAFPHPALTDRLAVDLDAGAVVNLDGSPARVEYTSGKCRKDKLCGNLITRTVNGTPLTIRCADAILAASQGRSSIPERVRAVHVNDDLTDDRPSNLRFEPVNGNAWAREGMIATGRLPGRVA